jgi:hypothetical protein
MNDDLAEKLTVGEMAQSCAGIVEGKHTAAIQVVVVPDL